MTAEPIKPHSLQAEELLAKVSDTVRNSGEEIDDIDLLPLTILEAFVHATLTAAEETRKIRLAVEEQTKVQQQMLLVMRRGQGR